MLIHIGFHIELAVTSPTALIYMLNVHPSRAADIQGEGGERVTIRPHLQADHYVDVFGNHCARVEVPQGVDRIRLRNEAVVFDTGWPDVVNPHATNHHPARLPATTLQFLLPSRYCEVDSELLALAWNLFGNVAPGWQRVQAICDFVHQRVRFDYACARATRTALEVFRERVGVCRDFTHLAITLCRCLNIPARYATGYLGDIGVPVAPYPMDFSAWFEAYLGDRWYTFDARHNVPRIGRIVIAHGRDAADVPITMVFGASTLERFEVTTDEVVAVPADAQPQGA
ncbi:Transglutaminase-like enzyme, putative cysteine protease [Variovorax sp. HW608]|uniref:transglutaminase-like domain-containing protein n=1 Tax=Variovorax sp. HW608 TaxID=1034889 RepID=UPI00081FCDAC|nr:transglutaminase family protein [Variovorax sp. HW608]SCK61417.1 Transglutaminase-like enzyme, putative cysteine protease [Variovorax sp. HW608]